MTSPTPGPQGNTPPSIPGHSACSATNRNQTDARIWANQGLKSAERKLRIGPELPNVSATSFRHPCRELPPLPLCGLLPKALATSPGHVQPPSFKKEKAKRGCQWEPGRPSPSPGGTRWHLLVQPPPPTPACSQAHNPQGQGPTLPSPPHLLVPRPRQSGLRSAHPLPVPLPTPIPGTCTPPGMQKQELLSGQGAGAGPHPLPAPAQHAWPLASHITIIQWHRSPAARCEVTFI